MIKQSEERKNYSSTGFVLGKMWGGGFGAYSAKRIESKSLKELLKENQTMLENGSLDSGMGFEYLKGALLYITETKFIMKDGDEYNRKEFSSKFIGKLDTKEKDFLSSVNCV